MTTLIAPCGLDCAKCEAYTLTQANDQAGLEVLLAKWKVEFNAPDMTIKDVTCDGCLAASGKVGGYCSMCEIRKCAQEKSLATACNKKQPTIYKAKLTLTGEFCFGGLDGNNRPII